jgi:hypothetical protein
MSKTISHTTYWSEFLNNNPNPEPIQAFFAKDPFLTKIFNVVAVPDIFSTIDRYPFDEKLSEFSAISSDDVDHLYDAQIRKTYESDKKAIEWLDYLVALFELVGTTIKFYGTFKSSRDFSSQELLEFTSLVFRNFFSIDVKIIYKNTEEEEFREQLIGRIFKEPTLFRTVEVPGEVPKVKVQLYFLFEPKKEYIEFLKTHLDFKSVINFRRFRTIRPLADVVCYGGYHPYLDDIEFYPKLGIDKIEDQKFLVEFFHKGKKLDNFEYSIRKRYMKELRGTAKKRKDAITRDEYIRFADEELFRCIEQFDESEGKPPAHYIKASLRYVPWNIYKSESTTIVPDEYDKDRIRKTELEHSGEIEMPAEEHETNEEAWSKVWGGDAEERKEISKSDTFEKVWSKDAIIKIKNLICKDKIDINIIDMLIDGTGLFKNSDEINFSGIADALGTYDNDIRRRWEKIQNRVQKHPDFKKFFE